MKIKFNVIEHPADKPLPEICTFDGIRYDKESKLAILSTEHEAHDYLMPIATEEGYIHLCEKLFSFMSKSLVRQGLMVIISGSPLYRVKHGSKTVISNPGDYKYQVDGHYDGTEFSIGRLFK